MLAGSEAVEHLVEAGADRDQHGDHGERIEECRQHRGRQADRSASAVRERMPSRIFVNVNSSSSRRK